MTISTPLHELSRESSQHELSRESHGGNHIRQVPPAPRALSSWLYALSSHLPVHPDAQIPQHVLDRLSVPVQGGDGLRRR
jgi:hypothetical protein